MIKFTDVKGVIFDVDETLLDTGLTDVASALHGRARLQALREAGNRHNLPALLEITPEENHNAFLDAPVHSPEGAIWQVLFICGLVNNRNLEIAHPLLQEIAKRKNELYINLLRQHGKAVPGAVEFVRWLAAQGLSGHMAIASTAVRAEIDVFLDIAGLAEFFPSERIIAKDDVEHVKPHPEAFDSAFKSLGLPDSDRGKVLAFEDNPRGVLSAKGAGLNVYCITTIYSKKDLQSLDVPPDFVADSFDEFRRHLEA